MRCRQEQTRRRGSGDDGFSLIEAVVGITLLAFVLAGLGLTTGASLKSLRSTKRFQQATGLGDLSLEDARNREFDALVLSTASLTGDPRITTGSGGVKQFDPDGSRSTLGAEPVVHASTGLAHSETQTVDGESYTLLRYITWVNDATTPDVQDYKRFLVRVSWTVQGETRSYETSTFLTPVRRGLPLPKFVVDPTAKATNGEQGATVVFAHGIHNQGIVDTYEVAFTVPSGRTWTIGRYRETNGVEGYQSGADAVLTDTNGNGTLDTGSVATDGRVTVYAVIALGASEAAGDAVIAGSVTSGASSTVQVTLSDTIRVTAAGRLLYLRESTYPSAPSANKNTPVSGVPLPMRVEGPPTAATLYRYSNNFDSSNPGRTVDKSTASAAEPNQQYMVSWAYQVPNTNTVYQGGGEIVIWVRKEGGDCTKSYTVRGFLRHKASSSDTAGTSLTTIADVAVPAASGSGCTWQQITMPFTVSSSTPVAKDRWVELKLVVRDTSSGKLGFAYDTAAFPSTVRLPQVSG